MNSKAIYVKIFGERNSGTNYLQQLIKINFKCSLLTGNTQNIYYNQSKISLINGVQGKIIQETYQDIEHERILSSDFGWKHGCVPINDIIASNHSKYTLFVVIVKNPYFWIRSMYEKPYHNFFQSGEIKNFKQFLKTRWITVKRDGVGKVFLDSPVELWTLKSTSYLLLNNIPNINCVFLRYEDLLADFQKSMEMLAESLECLNDEFVNISKSTKTKDFTYEDYKNKYSPDKLLEILDSEDIKFLNDRIPTELMKLFGYKKI